MTGMLLTPRQREYLTLRANGYTAREIASACNTTYAHVRNVLYDTFLALRVHTSAEAVAVALRVGEIEEERIVVVKERRPRHPDTRKREHQCDT